MFGKYVYIKFFYIKHLNTYEEQMCFIWTENTYNKLTQMIIVCTI